ncbi:MAG: 2Fe-2S iron-sulfur cluster-binding protein [Acidimicrobiales bacterium]|nr:2Fe-2S iron-sulfur cluster-binding protein [Acidimicrobiales bacterium]
MDPELSMVVDGRLVTVPDDDSTLLDVLRRRLGITSAKDGCSPQGQCGCCTVLVDGQPRVSCVTPARRVAGRTITTLDGLPETEQRAWADAFCSAGGSQCGFCTPGIVVRFAGLRAAGETDRNRAARALHAHLCRCTGWQTIIEAWDAYGTGTWTGDPELAARRAELEGHVAQAVGPDVVLGRGGFAADTVPDDHLVAVPDSSGGFGVGETLAEARTAAGKVQGRRTTVSPRPPLDLPPGDWTATLRTSWVEPAYLETDAAWCVPGGEPSSPLANGGAFGGKARSSAPAEARRLADEHGRPVLVLYAREDTVRLGPKRPPVAGGVDAAGRGVLRVARTPGIAEAVARVAPDLVVEEVDVAGPPTSADLRAAGWAEAVALLTGARGEVGTVTSPDGGSATAEVDGDGIRVTVRCGEPLDETVLRSYCVGAAHMAWSWVTSESLVVDDEGAVHDLTVRSFDVVRATETPPIRVEIQTDAGEPCNGSDAVFVAVAAATWLTRGVPESWPTGT